jgi:hypothetical protein
VVIIVEVTIVEINIVAVTTVEVTWEVVSTVEAVKVEVITMNNVSVEVTRIEISPNQDRELKKEVFIVQKKTQVKEGLPVHIHILLILEG